MNDDVFQETRCTDPMDSFVANELKWSIDCAGGERGLLCGTSNFFSGWVVQADESDPIVAVRFSANMMQEATLPIKHERVDLLPTFGKSLVGFWGPVLVPATAFRSTLRVEAVSRSGALYLMKEYPLSQHVSDDEVQFVRRNDLPEDLLRHLVVSDIDPHVFVRRGKEGVELIKNILEKNSIQLSECKNVLDFGVGCGRIIRWWEEYSPQIQFWGTDVNEELIAWCRTHITFAKFFLNKLLPPTVFESDYFDLLYAYSVFTHLSIDSQRAWIREFARILSPGRYAVISVHGEHDACSLPRKQYELLHKKGFLTMSANAEGENMCASYQTRQTSEALFSELFEVIDYLPGARASTSRQDVILLRKR